MLEDKIEEVIEKLLRHRNILHDDLKNYSDQLSTISQVVLMAEIAKIDEYVKDLKQKLEDVGWLEFLRQSWGEDGD